MIEITFSKESADRLRESLERLRAGTGSAVERALKKAAEGINEETVKGAAKASALYHCGGSDLG